MIWNFTVTWLTVDFFLYWFLSSLDCCFLPSNQLFSVISYFSSAMFSVLPECFYLNIGLPGWVLSFLSSFLSCFLTFFLCFFPDFFDVPSNPPMKSFLMDTDMFHISQSWRLITPTHRTWAFCNAVSLTA